MEENKTVILVAEDEAIIRDLVKLMLLREGYVVLTAKDADETLEISQKFTDPIHLLLLDPVMHRDGLSLAKRVREQRPEIKVMIMSGDTMTEITENTPVVKKPFLSPTLLQCVQRVLTSSFHGVCHEVDLRRRLKDSSPPTA